MFYLFKRAGALHLTLGRGATVAAASLKLPACSSHGVRNRAEALYLE